MTCSRSTELPSSWGFEGFVLADDCGSPRDADICNKSIRFPDSGHMVTVVVSKGFFVVRSTFHINDFLSTHYRFASGWSVFSALSFLFIINVCNIGSHHGSYMKATHMVKTFLSFKIKIGEVILCDFLSSTIEVRKKHYT